jgi:hypothetical protein
MPLRYSNKFKKLEVYSPSEAFLRAPDVAPAARPATQSGTSKPDAGYEIGRMQDFVEAYLAFYLLLCDLANSERFMYHTWAGYRNGYSNWSRHPLQQIPR